MKLKHSLALAWNPTNLAHHRGVKYSMHLALDMSLLSLVFCVFESVSGEVGGYFRKYTPPWKL